MSLPFGLNIAPGLFMVLGGLAVALICGTLIRLLRLRGQSSELATVRRQSLVVWWALFLLLAVSLLLGRMGVAGLIWLAGTLAFVEFHRLLDGKVAIESRRWWCVAGLGLGYYLLLALGYGLSAYAGFPIAAVAIICVTGLMWSEVRDYLSSAAALLFAALVFYHSMSHAVLLVAEPGYSAASGMVGTFLYLVLLTEISDIAQALTGRAWGRTPIAPRLSPHKTWEGFVGGGVVTVPLALLLAHPLLPESLSASMLDCGFLGLVIFLAGFAGDLNMSAFKRAVGAKDSGQLLPGMGGVIDRIDSLTFSAPAFYFTSLYLLK